MNSSVLKTFLSNLGFNPDELVQMVQFIAQNAHDINVRLSRIESILIREELIKQIEKESTEHVEH